MIRRNLLCALFGASFGGAFTAGGFNHYDVIHRMLLLQNFAPFLIMGSAIAVALPIIWVLERRSWRTFFGGVITPRRWAIEPKHLFGGVVFGTGWAVTGACPGTVSAMLASGAVLGAVPLAGILIGMYLRDTVVERAERDHQEELTVPAAAEA